MIDINAEDMKEIKSIIRDCVGDVMNLQKQEAAAKKPGQKKSLDDIIAERMKKYE